MKELGKENGGKKGGVKEEETMEKERNSEYDEKNKSLERLGNEEVKKKNQTKGEQEGNRRETRKDEEGKMERE